MINWFGGCPCCNIFAHSQFYCQQHGSGEPKNYDPWLGDFHPPLVISNVISETFIIRVCVTGQKNGPLWYSLKYTQLHCLGDRSYCWLLEMMEKFRHVKYKVGKTWQLKWHCACALRLLVMWRDDIKQDDIKTRCYKNKRAPCCLRRTREVLILLELYSLSHHCWDLLVWEL